MRSRLRYPEGIFTMQAAVYATYHMTNPSVFYNKEDLWEVPAIDGEARPQLMQPYYTVMRLPGERQAEFIQMLPFTPARKDNLASWMVARSDGEHYGRMMVFQFPKQKVVFGPRQVVARINQDQVISPQITLWNQQGSEVLQGTLLVIPIEESLIYIRPLYLVPPAAASRAEARHRRAPESDRDGGDAGRRAQPAVPERSAPPAPALTPPSGASPPAAPLSPESSDELSARAMDHYRRALQSQREGNWAQCGEDQAARRGAGGDASRR